MQLKCRASATQRQPPINKRDYRRTNKCAGGSFHGRPASQRCQPPLFLSLSLPLPSLFLFLPRPAYGFTCSFSRLRERVRFRHQRHLHNHHYLFFFLHLPLRTHRGSCSPLLSRSFSCTHIHTHIHMRRQTFCLLPVALTIKRWRRRGCAAMFPIPLVSVGNLPPPRGRFASGHPRDEEKSE